MANTALTFSFSTKELRAVLIDGEPWFVASDVCEALEHSDTSKAVSRLDDDEKLTRTLFASGQNREMLVINESGLYSLILTSRKPEAKKFKKWVTSEVLPAIRKTGRYVEPAAEPQPAPTSAREKLNASDMQHIKRVVWFAARNFHRENAACQGIWHHLREVTYNPAPNAYSVDHIPVLAVELRRIVSLCEQVGQITRHVEEQAVKRIFRKGETAEKVLAHLSIEAARDVQKLSETVAEFPAWMEADLIGFSERRPALFVNHYEPEQSDFFVSGS